MTTVRSSRASRRCACLLALAIAVVGGAQVSAHRRDEYLQAARLAIDPAGVQIDLDLTPGIALADEIIGDIDHDRNGSLSAGEERAYASLIASALQLEIDGRPVGVQLGSSSFPDPEAMRRGEGTIRLHSVATLPPLSVGAHHLLFRNKHDADRSVYLANALVPESDRVAVTAQRRDGGQSELMIDYVLDAAPATSARVWWLGSIAAAAVVWALLVRSPRRLVRNDSRVAPVREAIW